MNETFRCRIFYDEDLKISLDNNVEKLKTVIFQKRFRNYLC